MTNPSESPLSRGYAIALVATIIWSSAAVFVGYLTVRFHMPPLALAFWRDLIVATALFGILFSVARPLLRLERQHVLFFVLYGLVLGVFNGLWITAVALNGAAVATVLAYSSPAFTALIGWRWLGERLDGLKIGAVVLCFVGCVFVSGAYEPAAWRFNPIGILTGLASGAAFALYSLLGKVSSRRGINPWTATLYSFAFAAVSLLFVQRPDTILWLSRPLADGPGGWRETILGWGTLIVLAIGPALGGYGLYTFSLTLLPAATANLVATLEPAMTAALAYIFLGERLTIPQLLGACLILVGVVLVRIEAPKRTR